MTQYNSSNVKLSNLQLNKFKICNKKRCWSNSKTIIIYVAKSNGETNFMYKLLLTHRQVSKLHTAFANNSSANKIKLF